jgi:GTP-binding protein
MKISSAQFVISNTEIQNCPEPDMPEYAFIGRSNVGKSSLINMICERSKLAKTSGKPGKTQLINHFIINKNWYLVDLPGYGYAKISKTVKDKWVNFIMDYILKRKNLMCMMVLIDSRLPLQQIDLEFMNWLGENQVAFVMVFTKMDKNSKQKTADNIQKIKDEMLNSWDELPKCFYTSAEKNVGQKELLDFIEESNELYVK